MGFGFLTSETKALTQVIITKTVVASNFLPPLHFLSARDGREKARASTQMPHLAPSTPDPVPAVFSQVSGEKR